MAKIKNNPILKGVTGNIGKTVVVKKLNDTQYLANMPATRRKVSEKQKKNSFNFWKATQYAKNIMRNPEWKAEYAKGIAPNKNNAFRVALTDFLNPPVVRKISAPEYTGAIGDRIFVHATDDFKVTAVKVKIVDSANKILESGDAIQNPRKRHRWKYVTTVANPNVAGTRIKVIAYDNPGHEGTGELVVGN